jgi:hypothetical protein
VPDEPFRPDVEVTSEQSAGSPADPVRRRRQQAERRRRRRRLMLGAVALVAVAAVIAAAVVALSSGGGRTPKTTSRRVTPTTAAATTTSSSAPTASTVIPRSSNPMVALAQQYDGRYVGIFTNTTFHTTGPANLDLHVDPSSGILTAAVDLNGDLFGGGAKQVRRIDATVTLGGSNPVVVSRTAAFGPVTAKLGTGFSIVLTAADVPDPKVKTFELTGMLRSDLHGFDATFTVGFRDGQSAQGTVTVLCAPQGQRPSQVTTVCGPM